MSDPKLLPNNSTTLERHLAELAGHVFVVDDTFENLFNPETCHEDLLPWLAATLSADEWASIPTVLQKRSYLRSTVFVHRKKAVKAAVQRVLSALGFDVEFSQWFENGGAPHTFRITAFNDEAVEAGFVIDPGLYLWIERQIKAVKPVRSHLELLIGERFDTEVLFCNAMADQATESLTHDILVSAEDFSGDAHMAATSHDLVTSSDTHSIDVRLTRFETDARAASASHYGVADTIMHDIKPRGTA